MNLESCCFSLIQIEWVGVYTKTQQFISYLSFVLISLFSVLRNNGAHIQEKKPVWLTLLLRDGAAVCINFIMGGLLQCFCLKKKPSWVKYFAYQEGRERNNQSICPNFRPQLPALKARGWSCDKSIHIKIKKLASPLLSCCFVWFVI